MKWISLSSFCRLFLILTLSTSLAIISIGTSPPTMRGLASSVSSQFFLDIIRMEMPLLKNENTDFTFSNTNILTFLFQMVTNVSPQNPKTLLAREVPYLDDERTSLLYGGGSGHTDEPVEYGPHPKAIKPEFTPVTEGSAEVQENNQPPHESPPASPEQTTAQMSKNLIFIYHSHNRESWLPELKNVKDPDMAFDSQKNITLLGKRMAQKLNKSGIGTVHSTQDYPSAIKDFKYPKSYQYSKQTVVNAFNAYPDLKFMFDIHRDSQTRKKTTITINNKNYAQIYFVIGEKNPNWESNMELAKKIHDMLNKKYPGLSKGIYSKSSKGNGEYNQSLSPNISLIEIGGVENTLDESYRTADILADVIAELYWENEKEAIPVMVKP